MDRELIRQLITEKVTGTISEADEQILANLITENPDIKKEFLQAEQDYIKFLSDPHYKDANSELTWDKIERGIARRRKKRRYIRYATAAVISVAIVLLAKLFLPDNHEIKDTVVFTDTIKANTLQLQFATGEVIDLYAQPPHITMGGLHLNIDTNAKVISFQYDGKDGNGSNILKVPPGLNYQIILPDSSKIRLNSVTELTFPLQFTKASREISLSGEAYMEIAPGSSPFIVNTPHATIKVLGTTFNVNTYKPGNTKVSLVKGKVSCATGKQQVTLEEGKAAIVRNDAIKVEKINEEDLYWLTGRYKLDRFTLSQTAAIIYRLYGVEVVIDNKEIGDRVFTTTILRYEPLEAFMDFIRSLGYKVYIKNGKYHWHI